jgi:hypothetical protein
MCVQNQRIHKSYHGRGDCCSNMVYVICERWYTTWYFPSVFPSTDDSSCSVCWQRSHHIRRALTDFRSVQNWPIKTVLRIVYTYERITARIPASPVSRFEENAVARGLFLCASFDSRSNCFRVVVRECIYRCVMSRRQNLSSMERVYTILYPRVFMNLSSLTVRCPRHHHFPCQIL